ncbi:uncharacterized protein SPAPADRAFT_72090 [Spathaspora passalidarum NRRL Y-27907]|uniref:Alpha-1,3-mannosyltransferase n=1 Tax=Spathaspora passalidarum (strain NRRL Y-27907 / 11-Y1) TaxID=619300 RepID=G3AR66_SPAPN|nr:uncharacterized protein SPAPADRAFT_72090 [Spathaspora passalidarum NRRL Y-27907]EGW31241.1 hypothetical protein SPAPADRAFT_72090 [Spathaspora passalidarum NRRL Y-27907]
MANRCKAISQAYLLKVDSNDADITNENLFHILQHLGQPERCKLYFSNVYSLDQIVDPTRHIDFTKLPSFEDFEKEQIKKLQEESEKKAEEENENNSNVKLEITQEIKDQMKQDYENLKLKVIEEEQILHDYLTHIKVFNKCYLEDYNKTTINHQQGLLRGFKYKSKHSLPKPVWGLSVKKLERKVFPWLSQKSPIYESNNVEYTLLNSFKGSFLKAFQKKLSGKGIVLTISDAFSDECIRLIHLLRFLNNKLPLQIVHTEQDLSGEIKYQIRQACTQPFHNLPKQSITFVDVTPAIHPDYLHKFGGFANKIVATLFNSFEEMMLIDADTVLAKTPESFFKLKKYRSSGALFYRDRAVPEIRTENDIRFFVKLMNSQLDTLLFDLKPATSKTWNNPFFKQHLNHVMESGLVLINRKKHFGQPLIMSNMNFYLPFVSRLYGDKELFWMSLVLSGDESFEFNTLPAAAIGEITPNEERENDIGRKGVVKGKELCANHPAHINDEDSHTLLWFNSGFKFCSKTSTVNFEEDFARNQRYTKFKHFDQFRTFFESKLIIKAAIVPPSEKLTVPIGEQVDGEPNVAWVNNRGYCSGYTWCAYSSIGQARKSHGEVGTIIEYQPEEVEYFKRLGDIWMSDFDYRSNEKKEIDRQEGQQ